MSRDENALRCHIERGWGSTDPRGAFTVIEIRDYQEKDAGSVGRLIADTYSAFNLTFVAPEERGPFLGPFRYARSPEEGHQAAIAEVVRASMVYVAVDEGEVVGVLRGRIGRLASLFVRRDRHRQGIGRRLVQRFEAESLRKGAMVVHVAAALYAVPFYLAMGFNKSTGVRSGRSFEGRGLKVQPMRKVLRRGQSVQCAEGGGAETA